MKFGPGEFYERNVQFFQLQFASVKKKKDNNNSNKKSNDKRQFIKCLRLCRDLKITAKYMNISKQKCCDKTCRNDETRGLYPMHSVSMS
jgi:formyltetrahydrofolate hydrolase